MAKPSQLTHHIEVMTCPSARHLEDGFVWNCGSANSSDQLTRGPACAGEKNVLFTWVAGVGDMRLPAGVGMLLASGLDHETDDVSLVLQIHYVGLQKQEQGIRNTTNGLEGIVLQLASQSSVRQRVGILRMEAIGGQILTGVQQVETACRMHEPCHTARNRIRGSHALTGD